jgi:hypothetical protein
LHKEKALKILMKFQLKKFLSSERGIGRLAARNDKELLRASGRSLKDFQTRMFRTEA